jgi:uncharacterized protein YukE
MQLQENRSAQDWGSVIADLAKRGNNLDAEAVALASEGDKLALDAELGIDGAAQRLKTIRADGVKKLMAANNLQVALESAKARHAEALKREAIDVEKHRRERIGENLTRYFAEVQKIDAALESLGRQFTEAKQSLDHAAEEMNGAEAAPLNQVRSTWGATLAAANCGLGAFIELGPQSSHISHRKPFAEYVAPFVEPWINSGVGKE